MMPTNPCAAVNHYADFQTKEICPTITHQEQIPMECYYGLLHHVLNSGEITSDRTGTGTISSFGHILKFNLNDGFPLLTGKFTSFNLVASELLWFLRGNTNNEDLRKINDNGGKSTIWEEWADEKGRLGPIYGKQWRRWGGSYCDQTDQISSLIDGLIKRPFSRRHILSAWNVADLPDERLSPQENVAKGNMALAPCHLLSQFKVRKLTFSERIKLLPSYLTTYGVTNDEMMSDLDTLGIKKYELSCMVTLRSSDLFLGLPFNIASYALLTHILANFTNMVVGELTMSIGDAHIYMNHISQTKELLSRSVTSEIPKLPKLSIYRSLSANSVGFRGNTVDSLEGICVKDFHLDGYNSLPSIKAPISV